MKYLFFAIALAVSGYANANESARQAKIAKIIEAQGMQQSFQQQIDQSRTMAHDLGKNLYQKMLSGIDITDEAKKRKLEQVFTQYIEHCSTMFTAREFVEIWSRFYGKNLSQTDLDQILAYYKSPAGKKDVAASREAMVRYTEAMFAEGQKRMNDAIEQLMADLKAALE